MSNVLQFPKLRLPKGTTIIASEPPETTATGTALALPATNRFIDAEIVEPVKERRSSRKQPKARRVEQLPVTCMKAPRGNGDLCGEGVLTIDYRKGEPYTATFDPLSESTPNAVMPVLGWERDATSIRLTSDQGLWTFTLATEDDGDDE